MDDETEKKIRQTEAEFEKLIAEAKAAGEPTDMMEELLEGYAPMARHLAGDESADVRVTHHPGGVDVRALRKSLDLTQAAFASRFGLSVHAVRKWEMGVRSPEAGTLRWLKLIEMDVDFADRVEASLHCAAG